MPPVLGTSVTNTTSWLVILKYLGLTLAAGSSIWGTMNKLAIEVEAGRKKLTLAGYVAIALTLLGLVISVVSDDLQRRYDAENSRQQLIAESKRTNGIIIAGQPLTSLKLTWRFHGLDRESVQSLQQANDTAMQFIRDQQGERDAQQNGAVFREDQLYPFLLKLARRFAKDNSPSPDSNVLVLLALDDDQNVVLPFGHFDDGGVRLESSKANASFRPSIEIGNHQDFGNADLQSWPILQTEDQSVDITWKLDPSPLSAVIDRQNPLVVSTAKLPNLLRIGVLFDLKELPFTNGNFARPEDQNFWNYPDYEDTVNTNFRGKLTPAFKDFRSTVQLVPNNSSLISFSYTLKRLYETLFLDTYGEANGNLRCIIFEYHLDD